MTRFTLVSSDELDALAQRVTALEARPASAASASIRPEVRETQTPAWGSPNIGVTSGTSQMVYTLYQDRLDNVAQDEVLFLYGEGSLRNDLGWNVEVASIWTGVPGVTAPNAASPTWENGGFCFEADSLGPDPIGQNVTPGNHYADPQRFYAWTAPQDYESLWVCYRVRARCSEANGNQNLTFQEDLGRIIVVRFR
jgi:hypothetical protein